jgi:uncharacterized protein (TIGR02231 family)
LDSTVTATTATAEPGLDAPITNVTVFSDGARVLRTGVTELAAGQGSITIGNLPASVDTSSVRVAARGRDLALVNVEVRRRVGTEPLREQTTRLRAEVERWRDVVRGLDDEDAAEQAALGFLAHLSEAAATSLARAVGSGRAGYDELSGMAGHLSASTAGTLAKKGEIAGRKRAAERELAAAEARLSAAEQGGSRPNKILFVEVTVDLEAPTATEVELDLTYHVSNASWRPLYDLVLDGERLNVSYLAEITQQTGEDWPEVALVLSTTRRGQSQTLPELSPWYIGRPQPPGPRATSAMLASGKIAYGGVPMAADEEVVAARAKSPQARMLAAEQAESESGAGITYTVARPLAVPGDGGPHKTLVARFDADAVLDYLTVPVLAPEAYLRATVTNGTLLLLPGRARIFHGAQFVGETHLDTVAPGEEFEVQLGVATPPPAAADDLGELTWKLALAPRESAAIKHRFTVEHPAQATVTGL